MRSACAQSRCRTCCPQTRSDRLLRVIWPGAGSANPALVALSVLTSLHHLTLDGNVLTRHDQQMLWYSLNDRLTQLRSFTWSDSRRTGRGSASLPRDCVECLAKHSQLDSLAITGTALRRAPWGQAVGWAHIATELERMVQLTHLSLAHTFMEGNAGVHLLGFGMDIEIDAAAAARALFPVIGTLTSLRSLDMSGMGRSNSAAALAHDLAAALPSLHKVCCLVLDGNKLSGPGHPAAAQPTQSACITATQLCNACATLSVLTRLCLAQCSLDATKAGSASCFAALGSLPSLHHLDLAMNPLQSTHELHALGRLRDLRHLDLRETQLLRPGFHELTTGLRALSALSRVDLSYNDRLTDEQLDAFAAQLHMCEDNGVMYRAEVAA